MIQCVMIARKITEKMNEIKRRGLDKNKYEDYLEIQKLWLKKEVQQWEKVKDYNCVVMDFGAEEIFHLRKRGLDEWIMWIF